MVRIRRSCRTSFPGRGKEKAGGRTETPPARNVRVNDGRVAYHGQQTPRTSCTGYIFSVSPVSLYTEDDGTRTRNHRIDSASCSKFVYSNANAINMGKTCESPVFPDSNDSFIINHFLSLSIGKILISEKISLLLAKIPYKILTILATNYPCSHLQKMRELVGCSVVV